MKNIILTIYNSVTTFKDQILCYRSARDAAAGEAPIDWAGLPIGGMIDVRVSDVKEYGLLCDMEGFPDLVGLVAPHQVGITNLDSIRML